jgi:hypothetical protein
VLWLQSGKVSQSLANTTASITPLFRQDTSNLERGTHLFPTSNTILYMYLHKEQLSSFAFSIMATFFYFKRHTDELHNLYS